MTEKAKNVNYTEVQASEMVERYSACDSDESRAACVNELAHDLNKGVRSIRAKLVREGAYVKKTYKTKNGAKAETKENIVSDIADALGVGSDQLGGLEKATKKALTLIRGTMIAAQSLIDSHE